MANENKVYLPQRKTRRGVAGWKLAPNMVVVDDKGKIVEKGSKVKDDEPKK